jgi:hypothetical protein
MINRVAETDARRLTRNTHKRGAHFNFHPPSNEEWSPPFRKQLRCYENTSDTRRKKDFSVWVCSGCGWKLS